MRTILLAGILLAAIGLFTTFVSLVGLFLLVVGIVLIVLGRNTKEVVLVSAPGTAVAPNIIQKEAVVQKEIVRVPCKFCGTLNDLATAKFCSSCGAPVYSSPSP